MMLGRDADPAEPLHRGLAVAAGSVARGAASFCVYDGGVLRPTDEHSVPVSRAARHSVLHNKAAMLDRAPSSWAGDAPDEPDALGRLTRSCSADAVLCQQSESREDRAVTPERWPAEGSPAGWPVSSAPASVWRLTEAAGGGCESSSGGDGHLSAPSSPSRELDLSALYQMQVDAYNPSQDALHDEPRTSSRPHARQTPPRETQAASEPPELVQCADGAVRPALGLCFAFVAAPEKLDLMLTSGDDQCGEGILQRRRRESLEAAVPMTEIDAPGAQHLDVEVQRIVAQRRAPEPRKMRKPVKIRQTSS
eukprot:COSAG02_NODE_3464_length_6695_cov_12.759854_5_plen_308_part_00